MNANLDLGKKLLVLMSFGFFLNACSVKPLAILPYKGMYKSYLKPGETESTGSYQTMVAKGVNYYVLRRFYPEPAQLLAVEYFSDAKLMTRIGTYKKWHENGLLATEGNFKNGKEDGTWKYYHRENGKIRSEGNFLNGKKVGDWKSYDTNSTLSNLEIHDQILKEWKQIQYDTLGNVIYEAIFKNDVLAQEIINERNNIDLPYLLQCANIQEEEARKKCSNEALLSFIYRNIRYPEAARKKGIEGTTITQFDIDKDGKVVDIEILAGVSNELKSETARLLSRMPQWVAGTLGGEPAKVRYTLPIKFKLED